MFRPKLLQPTVSDFHAGSTSKTAWDSQQRPAGLVACLSIEAPDAHSRVAPGAAYAYAKIPLREGPPGTYSDDAPWCQVQTG